MNTLEDWLGYIEQLHPRAWDLGLERVGAVARALDVTKPATRVVLVAGTNGKGSTCEAIERLCRQCGFVVGKSTSPHLIRFNERIAIDGEPVADDEIVAAFEAINSARGATSLSYFEFGALAAMWIFKRRAVDIAVLEIGLGGRLDAMNVAEPTVSVITRIALDHQDWLGDDREVIGTEKAGIMRPGVPCVVAERNPPASVLEHARQIGAPLYRLGEDFGNAPQLMPGVASLADLVVDAPRGVPVDNLLGAIRATALLDVPLSTGQVDVALQGFELPGRYSLIEQPRRIILDVAHNPDAAAWLAQRLASEPRRACHAVFGMYADKDVSAVVSALAPQIDAWHLAADGGARAATVDVLAAHVLASGGEVAGKYANIRAAFDAAVERTEEGDIIVGFGSFVVVGEVLKRSGEHR